MNKLTVNESGTNVRSKGMKTTKTSDLSTGTVQPVKPTEIEQKTIDFFEELSADFCIEQLAFLYQCYMERPKKKRLQGIREQNLRYAIGRMQVLMAYLERKIYKYKS